MDEITATKCFSLDHQSRGLDFWVSLLLFRYTLVHLILALSENTKSMITVVVLKVLHYLSLFLAGGLGIANAMLYKNHQKAKVPPAPPVQKTMMTLARLGLFAVLILWATGIALTYRVYGSFSLGWAFHLKLIGAAILLSAVIYLNIYMIIRAKREESPSPKVLRIVSPITRVSLLVILIGVAVLTT